MQNRQRRQHQTRTGDIPKAYCPSSWYLLNRLQHDKAYSQGQLISHLSCTSEQGFGLCFRNLHQVFHDIAHCLSSVAERAFE